jgi:sortase A
MWSVRRALRILSVALVTAGIVILVDVGVTLAWKEPASSIYGSIQQGNAEDQLEALSDDFPSDADIRALERVTGVREKVRLLAERFAGRVEPGTGIGNIRVPAAGLDAVVVEGTDTSALQRGPGHYPETPFPGEGGTVAIAGHRTTYLAPLRHIDELAEGDPIAIEMPYASFTYEVDSIEVVEPTDVEVVAPVGHERVVLTACHPLYSDAQRIAVSGRLADVSLFAAGDQRWVDP